ncbi:MAG: hypothetical protein LBS55_13180 [Prevotellaceae bacterium]|jgi:hypothetical protein|nr:hypothetical protein [Prevotellaceae bacterium]
MEIKEVNKKSGKPFIIANPIYDTVFKRLMENQRIVKFYILGTNLAEIDCPCVKVGRTYTDMLNKTTINASSQFTKNLTHNSYVIQTGRITNVRYTTNLDKLLSIFEQKYFIEQGIGVRKEYPYQPDDENMELITDILYEMGADPIKRKEIEDEIETRRTINVMQSPLKKTIEERDKENAGLREKLAEMERLFRNKQLE